MLSVVLKSQRLMRLAPELSMVLYVLSSISYSCSDNKDLRLAGAALVDVEIVAAAIKQCYWYSQ